MIDLIGGAILGSVYLTILYLARHRLSEMVREIVTIALDILEEIGIMTPDRERERERERRADNIRRLETELGIGREDRGDDNPASLNPNRYSPALKMAGITMQEAIDRMVYTDAPPLARDQDDHYTNMIAEMDQAIPEYPVRVNIDRSIRGSNPDHLTIDPGSGVIYNIGHFKDIEMRGSGMTGLRYELRWDSTDQMTRLHVIREGKRGGDKTVLVFEGAEEMEAFRMALDRYVDVMRVMEKHLSSGDLGSAWVDGCKHISVTATIGDDESQDRIEQ